MHTLTLALTLLTVAQDPDTAEIHARPVVGTIAVGQTRQDSLSHADLVRSGRHLRVWRFQGTAGATVTIDLASDDFDALLFVTAPGHTPLSDDDGGGVCNARITFTPGRTDYRIAVTSLAGSGTGRYTLRATTQPLPVADGPCAPNVAPADDFPAAEVEALRPAGELSVGGVVRGQLSSGHTVAGKPAVVYTLPAPAGQTLTIDLRSAAFDAVLGVIGPGFSNARSDDDGAGLCDARLSVTFPANGTYRVIATSVTTTASGPFTLAVTRDPGPLAPGTCSDAQRASPATLAALPIAGDLAPGTPVSGALRAGHAALDNGALAQAYRLRGRANERYHVSLASSEVDAFLFITGPSLLRTDDDGGGATDACLAVTFPANGEYRVVASSFAFEQGTFRLQARPLDAGAPDPCEADEGGEWNDVTVVGRLVVGEEVQGRLDRNASLTPEPDSGLALAYELDGLRGEQVTVDLISTAFDAAVILIGPGIIGMMMDDDSGGACNARLTINFPETGTFRVIATTMIGGEGPFVLRATHLPGPTDPSSPCRIE